MSATQLTRIHARDLMQTDVLRFTVSTPIERAIEQMEEAKVGGAPVIDTSGRIVGVLTSSDIARIEHVRAGVIDDERGTYRLAAVAAEDDDDEGARELMELEDYSPQSAGGATVGDWMNPEVVQVPPDASLRQVCRTMIEHGIHRVLVVEGRELRGIVSTLDVVRCVAERL